MKDINQHWESIYYHLRYEYEDNLSHQAIRILQIVSREKDITIGKVATELSLSHNTASEHKDLPSSRGSSESVRR